MPAVATLSTFDIPANSSQIYEAVITDHALSPVPPSLIDTLTLTIVDTLSGAVVNNCLQQSILNTGRGFLRILGLLTVLRVTLLPADLSMDEVPSANRVQRSLIFDFTYNYGLSAGRHQVNFFVTRLAGQ